MQGFTVTGTELLASNDECASGQVAKEEGGGAAGNDDMTAFTTVNGDLQENSNIKARHM